MSTEGVSPDVSSALLGCGDGHSSADAGGGTGGGAGASAGGRGGGGSGGASGSGGSVAGTTGSGGSAAGATGSGGSAAGTTGSGGSAGGGVAGAGGTAGGSGGTTGSAGSSGLACGVQPCGGDPVGNWTFVSACVDKSALEAQLQAGACPTVTVNSVSIGQSGTITFTTTAYSVSATRNTMLNINYPMACIAPNTCADLEAAFAANTAIQSASCTGDTLCACALTYVPQTSSEQGTYTTAGNMLTLTPTGGSPSTGAFCVEGNNLHLLGTDSTGQVTGDQVAERF